MYQLFFIFVMLINSNNDATILKGEPIVLTINISSGENLDDDYRQAARYDLDVKLQNKEISQEEYEQKLKALDSLRQEVYTIRAGDNNWPGSAGFQVYSEEKKAWGDLPWKVDFLSAFPDTGVIRIEADSYLSADFGIDPEITRQMKPAKYRFRAYILAYFNGKNMPDTAFSSEAIMQVEDKTADMNNSATLAALTEYYLRTGDHAKALDYASKYFEIMKDKPEGYTLMGKVYEGMKDYNKALEYYFKATEKLTPGHDPEFDEFLGQQIQKMLNLVPEPIIGTDEQKK